MTARGCERIAWCASAWPPRSTRFDSAADWSHEVPAGPGRRAFVDITPTTDDQDRVAEQEGWKRSNRNRALHVEHWDHDEKMIDRWDYNIGAKLARKATARDEQAF